MVNAVCPGWVRTDMGGPGATRSVEEGAASILATLNRTNSAEEGRCPGQGTPSNAEEGGGGPAEGQGPAPSGQFFRNGCLLEW